jgi:hypothetical protein
VKELRNKLKRTKTSMKPSSLLDVLRALSRGTRSRMVRHASAVLRARPWLDAALQPFFDPQARHVEAVADLQSSGLLHDVLSVLAAMEQLPSPKMDDLFRIATREDRESSRGDDVKEVVEMLERLLESDSARNVSLAEAASACERARQALDDTASVWRGRFAAMRGEESTYDESELFPTAPPDARIVLAVSVARQASAGRRNAEMVVMPETAEVLHAVDNAVLRLLCDPSRGARGM